MAQSVRTQEIIPIFYFEGAHKLVLDVFVPIRYNQSPHSSKSMDAALSKGILVMIIIIDK